MEVDERKRKSSIGPKEKSERGSPVERLRERSREERKETNSEAEYGNREGTHEKSGRREWGSSGSDSGEGAPGKPL